MACISRSIMKPIGVLYATREGHTRRIAQHIVNTLRNLGLDAEARDLRTDEAAVQLTDYAGAILAASVHGGKHEPEMVNFVKEHRGQLESIPAAFLSVTLSEAGAERADATPRQHAQFVADVQKVMDRFFADTSWHPKFVKPVAGALLYTKYNMLIRFVLKRIAKKSGGATDTSRDYDYTDWKALDQFIDEYAGQFLQGFLAQSAKV